MDKLTALYIRVSTEAQADEGYSIGAQSEKLTAYCKMKGIQTYEPIIDGGFTGSNLDRPGIKKLISLIESGQVERVVVYKLDRLSRSQKDTLYLIEDVFLPNAVDFVSINENIDTGSPYGRAMIGILSAFAQLERENIFLRTRMGMAERVKNGYWPGGGKIPFGYDYNPQEGTLVPNEEAPVVRLLFEQYLAGLSAGKLARLYGFSHEQSVTQLLRHRLYTGVIPYKNECYPGRHQPLVSEEIFQQVQKRMKSRKKTNAGPAGYLLTGLLVCGHCGARMRYQQWGKAGAKLVCYSRDRSKPHLVHDPHCPNNGVMAQEVEAIVIRDLQRLSVALPAASDQDTKDMISVIKKRQEQVERRLARLYSLYAEGEDETLRETIRKAKEELSELRMRIDDEEKLQEQVQEKRQTRERLRCIGSDWATLSEPDRRALVRDCIDKIVLTNDKVSIYYELQTDETTARKAV